MLPPFLNVTYFLKKLTTHEFKYVQFEKSSIENSIFKDPPFAERYTPAKAKCIAAVKSVLVDKIEQGPVVVQWLYRQMAKKGHPVSVTAQHDQVNLVIHKPVLMFSRYAKKLASLVQSVKGVNKVNARAGRLFYQTDILPGSNYFKAPTPAPIKKQYEQLYARVTKRRPAFMNRATADARLVAAHA